MVICPRDQVYKAKIIDLNSVIPFAESLEGYDPEGRDAGFTLGVKNLIKFICKLDSE